MVGLADAAEALSLADWAGGEFGSGGADFARFPELEEFACASVALASGRALQACARAGALRPAPTGAAALRLLFAGRRRPRADPPPPLALVAQE